MEKLTDWARTLAYKEIAAALLAFGVRCASPQRELTVTVASSSSDRVELYRAKGGSISRERRCSNHLFRRTLTASHAIVNSHIAESLR